MPPSTLVGLLLFLWLVTPGLFFNVLADRRRAASSASAFQEAARIALGSIVFSALGGIAAAAIISLTPASIDVGQLILEGQPYLGRHYQAIAAFLVLQVVLACVSAALVNEWLARRTQQATGRQTPLLTNESAWDRPLGHRPARSQVRVWLRLKSGIELRGMLAAFGHEIDAKDRELVLQDPIEIRYPEQHELHVMKEQRVIVQGADLDFVAVTYVESNDDVRVEAPKRWWQFWRKRDKHVGEGNKIDTPSPPDSNGGRPALQQHNEPTG